jgi:hypothetical protein
VTDRTIRYQVGNEHSPTDRLGRSELVIHPDGTARLDQFFARPGTPATPGTPDTPGVTGAWTGRIDPAALDRLRAELARAGSPDSTVRSLTIESGGDSVSAFVAWHQTSSLPGYAEAFDIIDGVIRQLSRDAVKYPTNQHQIVSDIAALPPGT